MRGSGHALLRIRDVRTGATSSGLSGRCRRIRIRPRRSGIRCAFGAVNFGAEKRPHGRRRKLTGLVEQKTMRNGQNKRMRGRNRKGWPSPESVVARLRIQRAGRKNPGDGVAYRRKISPACPRCAKFRRYDRRGALLSARRTLLSPDRHRAGAVASDASPISSSSRATCAAICRTTATMTATMTSRPWPASRLRHASSNRSIRANSSTISRSNSSRSNISRSIASPNISRSRSISRARSISSRRPR